MSPAMMPWEESVSEEDALQRLMKQDPTGLEALMRQYGALVLHVIRQVLTYEPSGDIEECATDVWLAVWQKADRFDGQRAPFRAWVCLLARHAAIDRLRRKADPAFPALSLDDDRLTAIQHDMQDIPELMEAQEEAEARSIRLNQALARLPEADRSLMIRRYFFFEPIPDLARDAGVSRAAIDNRLTRIRKRLRTLYVEVSDHA